MKFYGELVNPPPIRKRPGKPKKNKRKSKDEPKKISKVVKISRKGRIMACSHCKQEGHKMAGCPVISNNEVWF
ncbi:hypothetical protein SLEP1_g12412 [Rubroshorea leprosula]|uniref:CCHC-type domain-containing protein n=1 Tax=Rubroshorea leprosula TaxID=152421 RepID=A0AAV5ICG3_9ROSI|nr:hypothetical protein SLEP1_g12412 [Rubroshorea leprosula]